MNPRTMTGKQLYHEMVRQGAFNIRREYLPRFRAKVNAGVHMSPEGKRAQIAAFEKRIPDPLFKKGPETAGTAPTSEEARAYADYLEENVAISKKYPKRHVEPAEKAALQRLIEYLRSIGGGGSYFSDMIPPEFADTMRESTASGGDAATPSTPPPPGGQPSSVVASQIQSVQNQTKKQEKTSSVMFWVIGGVVVVGMTAAVLYAIYQSGRKR